MNTQNERVIIFKMHEYPNVIPKYIMDMMDKIPKHKEEDIIIARIPKELQKLYPKYVRHTVILKIMLNNYPTNIVIMRTIKNSQQVHRIFTQRLYYQKHYKYPPYFPKLAVVQF